VWPERTERTAVCFENLTHGVVSVVGLGVARWGELQFLADFEQKAIKLIQKLITGAQWNCGDCHKRNLHKGKLILSLD
jgi:hypothetical protein